MEIKYIFNLFLKWLWFILLVPMVAGIGTYLASTYRTVYVYEAEATLCIVNSLNDPNPRITAVYGDIISASNAVENYGEIIKSKSAINEALNELNLKEYSAQHFFGNISLVLPERDSFVVGINVRDVNPELACRMANKLSEILVEKINKLMSITVIEILDKAEMPANPINDETKKNVGIAVMAGIIFCIAIIFLVEYAESVLIKDKKDVVKYLELPVLAAIPAMKHIKMQK